MKERDLPRIGKLDNWVRLPARKGTDAMRRTVNGLTALGGSMLLAAGAAAAPTSTPQDKEIQPLLDKVSALSEQISRTPQSPEAWRLLIQQGEAMLQLAAHSKGDECEKFQRMAVDCYHGAAVQSPEKETAGYQSLVELTQRLGRIFPGSQVIVYATLQEIDADFLRTLTKSGDAAAKDLRRRRLLGFAQAHAKTPEAPTAILEAAQLSESLGKPDDARRCYHYAIDQYPGQSAARKAGGALWRMGLDGDLVRLALPQMYGAAGSERSFDLEELHGKLVVVYFWSSASAQAAEDFDGLKRLTDHHQFHGLEVVYVNMDSDPAQARTFLSGRLTAGTHVYQKGGLEGAVAESYGIQNLPQVFLIGQDGKLIRHSLSVAQLEAEVASRLRGKR